MAVRQKNMMQAIGGRHWHVGCVVVLGACLGVGCGEDFGPAMDAAGSIDAESPIDATGSIDAVLPDAAPSDAAVTDGDRDPCLAYEPNDSLGGAVPIEPGTYASLAICPGGDHDYFSFAVGDSQDMVVEALFDNMGGAGDLEMRLYNNIGERIDSSETFDNNERIARSLANENQLVAGTYIVEMWGFGDTIQNEYTLVLTITDS